MSDLIDVTPSGSCHFSTPVTMTYCTDIHTVLVESPLAYIPQLNQVRLIYTAVQVQM